MTKVRAGSSEVRATATDELRRLLDERGVEWWEGEDERKTHWRSNGLTWEYFNTENGDAWLGFLGACESDISPEQAVEATLGPLTERAAKDSEKDSDGYGECRAEETDTWECICDQIGRYGKRVTIHVMECSACGQTFEHVNGAYEYCPHCRRRLVIE